jgi:hypothetical protein
LEGTKKARALIVASMREEMRKAKDDRDLGRAAVILDDFVRSGLVVGSV